MLLDRTADRRTGSPQAWLASALLHLIVFGVLLYRPAPTILKGPPSLRGDGGRGRAIGLVAAGVSAPVLARHTDQDLHRLAPPARKKKRDSAPSPQTQTASARQDLKPGMPGFILGSLTSGLPGYHDIRIALATVAPDPPIDRSRLSRWINGNAIVEVTIDETGNVVQTRLLEGVGFGLDQLVMDTLRRWRYIPARVDGVAVASRQDVHFHFPS